MYKVSIFLVLFSSLMFRCSGYFWAWICMLQCFCCFPAWIGGACLFKISGEISSNLSPLFVVYLRLFDKSCSNAKTNGWERAQKTGQVMRLSLLSSFQFSNVFLHLCNCKTSYFKYDWSTFSWMSQNVHLFPLRKYRIWKLQQETDWKKIKESVWSRIS